MTLPALAHGVGTVYESPLPVGLYVAGAATAVLASLVVAARSRDREPVARTVSSGTAPRLLESLLRGLGLVGLLALVAFAVVDPGRGFTPAPLLFWVGLVVGVTFVSVAVGGVWERADPWLFLEDLYLVEAEGDRAPPAWLAAATLYALFWFELVSGVGFDARAVVVAVLAYAVYRTVVRTRYRSAWRDADPLSVLFGFAARISPLRLEGARIEYRGVGHGLMGQEAMPTHLYLAVFVLLASTTLDNVRETVQWNDFLQASHLDGLPAMLVDSIALAAFALPFVVPFVLVARWARRWFRDDVRSRPERHLAWSLVPIGVAYVLAHNFPLLMTGLPALARELLAGIGAAGLLEGYVASPQLVWFVEIALIVGGHVVGIMAAHRVALSAAGDRRAALASHVPLAFLMAGYTASTLWLLSLPLVV